MEKWLPIAEGIIIIALIAIVLIKLKNFNSASKLDQAVKIITKEVREELLAQFQGNRKEGAVQASQMREEMQRNFVLILKQGIDQGESIANRLNNVTKDNEARMQRLQSTVESKLEQMRTTVDERLNETLQKRVSASFEMVLKQLEALQQGLGKVDSLRTDMTSLQRAFTNIKSRGTWGEVQLGALLEQMLSSQQYSTSVKVYPRAETYVEYAIKLPGNDEIPHVWLPIDSKFPIEDYLKLVEAHEGVNLDLVREKTKSLMDRVKSQAREIKSKYISPPYTTNFAIMYLPAEGLYAEVVKQSGIVEHLQREYKVTVAGPSTLCALLNSLQMGFRTLAIQKQAGEIGNLLSAVKKTMEIHEDNLNKTFRSLKTSVGQLEVASKNVSTINNRLRSIEAMPEQEAQEYLPMSMEDNCV